MEQCRAIGCEYRENKRRDRSQLGIWERYARFVFNRQAKSGVVLKKVIKYIWKRNQFQRIERYEFDIKFFKKVIRYKRHICLFFHKIWRFVWK
jgi:hypothetical protein